MKIKRKDEFVYETQIGEHSLVMAVPALGGEDKGPTPPETFIASLGACVAAMLENWCYNRAKDPDDIEVEVNYSKHNGALRDIRIVASVPWVNMGMHWKDVSDVTHDCPIHRTICETKAIELIVKGR